MTRNLDHLPQRDVERLSAYLDDELSNRERDRLESRLQEEERLQGALQELRGAVGIMHGLPQVAPPRNFMLTPEMAGQREVGWRYPAMQFATALAAALLVAVIAFDALAPSLPLMAGAPALPAERREAPLAMEAQATEAPAAEPEAVEERAAQPTAPAAPEAEAGIAKEESDQAPSPSPQPTQTPTEGAVAAESPADEEAKPAAPLESEQELDASEGPSLSLPELGLLRWIELGLAVAVLGLLILTYRLRPERR